LGNEAIEINKRMKGEREQGIEGRKEGRKIKPQSEGSTIGNSVLDTI
jgi:hypothetical protein